MAPKKKPINKKPERENRNKQTKLEVLAEDLEKLDLENKLREEEESDEEEEEEIVVSRVEAKKVNYCEECSFPIEYCEFSDKWPLCEKWLETRFPEKLKELMELRDGDKNKNKKIDKKVAREVKEIVEGTEETRDATKSKRELLIRIDKRSKRKRLTLITGIEAFMEDAFKGDEKFLKDVVKIFGKKFACGCSIVKKPELAIEIQGNVPGKVAKYFSRELGVDISQIYVLQDKKKTKAADMVYDSDEDGGDSDDE